MNIAEIWLDFSLFKEYSLYSTSHHQLSWYFKKVSLSMLLQALNLLNVSFARLTFDHKGFFMIPCWVSAAPHQLTLKMFSQVCLCASALFFPLVSYLNVDLKLSLCKLSSSVPHFVFTTLGPISLISNFLAWFCHCWHFKMWAVK